MIKFDTDVLPLYASNIDGDTAYAPTYATIIGTVVFASTTTDTGLSESDGITIQDGTIDEDIIYTGAPITAQEVVDGINGNSTVSGAGIVAELLAVEGGYVISIRKTTTTDNELTLVDAVGGELVHLGLPTATATGGGTIDFDKMDQVSERRLLTMIEILRSFFVTLDSRQSAQLVHSTLGNIINAIPVGKLYTDLAVSVIGNARVTGSSFEAGTATVTVTTESGTDALTLGAGPFATLQAVADNLNGSLSNVTEVEFYVNGSHLGVRNVAGSEGVAFTLAIGSANGILDVAGIEPGRRVSTLEAVAEDARDSALARFSLDSRGAAL